MTVHDLNWADWFLLVIIAISAGIGIKRGLAREVLSLMAWVLACVIAWALGDHLATLMTGVIKDPALRLSCAILLLFVMTLLVGAMVNHLVSQLVKNSGLTGMDRFLGALFGIVRGVIIIIVVLVFLPDMVTHTSAWEHSVLIPRFIAVEHWFHGLAQDIAGFFHHSSGKP